MENKTLGPDTAANVQAHFTREFRFQNSDFLGIQRALQDQYRNEWIGVVIDGPDLEEGWVKAKVIAHGCNADDAYEQADDYYKSHPGSVVRLFPTSVK